MTAAAFRQNPLFSRWRPIDAARPAMSASWWQWVASTDSLTARLMVAGGEKPFRVRLLHQGVGWPRQDEAQALGIGFKRYAWLREVALCLDETPWVVARSVAPLTQLKGQRLESLGERSLGSWLFRQPGLVRGPLEATKQPPDFISVNGIDGSCAWGRRSVFYHGGLSLLVQEYFLGAMADDLGLPSR
ncbi:chorismate lyase [Halomonas sp. FeN2]|uniref:chorismate--pyruvate lyase family protein n=1 Tax=Halomonas sp. FeN2 TaxID=2832500 RepID=UPI0010D5DA76|nr:MULTISPECIES: chorismate lyase [unclassified Halomonas]TDV96658.1 chorismate lyase [Halomonas alkaliantarctica]UBR47935.1 chorismate lyase [Halomonas sp. FeN2]